MSTCAILIVCIQDAHYTSLNIFFRNYIAIFVSTLLWTKMNKHNTSIVEDNANINNTDRIDLDNFGNTFDSKHLIGTMVVFWGTILFIIGGAVYCWYRYFRNGDSRTAEDQENQTNDLRYDGSNTRRDTLILNLRRQSRRDTLILPFTLH